MQLNANEISELIKQRIAQFDVSCEIRNEGTITAVGDGIIRIYGLTNVMQGEMIALPGNQFAVALNLEQDSVGAVVMGSYTRISEGMTVKCTGDILRVPVGKELLGRVVNALGIPVDNKGSLDCTQYYPVESDAPGVIDRHIINEPIQTGYKSIDAMIPIGRGQRELIIGDRQTGKSTLAIDTIINQRDSGVKCIYVAIGQKATAVVNVVKKLKEHHVLDNTIVVLSSASESAVLQYLAPYSGCAMGEYFRDHGEDALIVYDDLSKQAVAYRQISLLLKRPSGREAYPGDIFYLHSRLLERSAKVNSNYIKQRTQGKIVKRTGSLTALPIIETQSGDVSAFIPTNVISITDGQIFLESNLFNAGIRPAINPGISVSRVGGSAQTNIIKTLSGSIRTALAQYRELAAFSQFSSELDDLTRKELEHGQKVVELLKQNQQSPMSIAHQAIILFASSQGYLEDIKLSKIKYFESELIAYFQHTESELIEYINNCGLYDKNIKNKFKSILETFKLQQSQ